MRRMISILICLALCCAFAFTASAAAAEVRSLVADITVHDDGEYSLTMTATVKFLSSPKTFYIPLATDADDVNVSGAEYDIDTIDGVECVVFESDHGFSGEMTFVVSCTVPDMAQEQEDGSQLFTLRLPEMGWEYPIADYEVNVSFPAEITAHPSWYSAYHGVDIENYLDISMQERSMHIKSFERLKDQETIKMELVFAPDSFALYHMPGQAVSFSTVLFWLLVVATLVYTLLFLRRKHLSASVRQTTFNDATAGEIPCQLSDMQPDIVGILAHWGNLGYLTITRSRNGRIRLHKQMEMGSERAALERKLFYSIFRTSDSIDASNPHLQRVVERVGTMLQKTWQQRLFNKKSANPKIAHFLSLGAVAAASLMTFDLLLPANLLRWFLLPIFVAGSVFLAMLIRQACRNLYLRRRYLLFAAAAILVLLMLAAFAGNFFTMLLGILLQIFVSLVSMYGGMRTKVGDDVVQQILGLRTFLKTAKPERLQNLMAADSQYFYHMLPFAEQLGVAQAFAVCCRRMPLEPCPWLIDSRGNPQTAMEFATAYAQIAAVIRSEQPIKLSEVIYG